MDLQQMNDHCKTVADILKKSNLTVYNEQCMAQIVKLLSGEVETARKNEEILLDTLKTLTVDKASSSNADYFKLKDDFDKLQREINELKRENLTISEKLNMQNEQQIKTITENFENTEMVMHAEIELLKESIEKMKESYEDEINMLKIKMNEKESNYTREMVNSSNKLRWLQNVNRELTNEIKILKQNNKNQDMSNNALKFDLKPVDNTPAIDNVDDFEKLNSFKQPKKSCLKKSQAGTSKEPEDSPPVKTNDKPKSKPTVFRGRPKSTRTNIPQLKPISDTNTIEKNVEKNTRRKRKLFNPEDTDYLANFEVKE